MKFSKEKKIRNSGNTVTSSVIYDFSVTYTSMSIYIMNRWRIKMEVKKEFKVDDKKSSLNLENRKKLSLTGVIEVVNFNDKMINLNTTLGAVSIKGHELKMTKLDVQNGDIIIMGIVNAFIYSTNEAKQDNETILKKLFK
jgi:sporulation protein YabP